MTITRLGKSDTHSKSLKSTVPGELVNALGLQSGSEIDWTLATILDGSRIIVGDTELEFIEGREGKKTSKAQKIERVILVRVVSKKPKKPRAEKTKTQKSGDPEHV